MNRIFVLIKSGVEIPDAEVEDMVRKATFNDKGLSGCDTFYAALTPFQYVDYRHLVGTNQSLHQALATVSQLKKWTDAKFFRDLCAVSDTHHWYNTIYTKDFLYEGRMVTLTILGVEETRWGGMVDWDGVPFAFKQFCAMHATSNDRLASFERYRLKKEPTTVYVVPKPDPFPPPPPVSYPGEVEVVGHVVAPTNPHQPTTTVEPDWVDRLIAFFKGKGKKHV